MLLLKIILLQLFWFTVVLFGRSIAPSWQFGAAFILIVLDFFIYHPSLHLRKILFIVALFLFVGFFNDHSLIWFKIISKDSYQTGALSLWLIFPLYYDQIFKKFQSFPSSVISLIGGIGGALTYWSAAHLGAIFIIPGKEEHFLLSQFFFWAIFFPASLWIYFNDNCWEHFLDKTIFFSFDRTGYLRHQKRFVEDINVQKLSQTILVTGGTSGIGEQTVRALSELGHKVYFTGRNHKKGHDLETKFTHAKFVSLDMANWNEVHEFAKECGPFDSVVFNAGSMPEKMIETENGVEFQCASQLLGHYYLMFWLKKYQKMRSGTRIVWVSSGGMYLKKLDLKSLFKNADYNKVDTYANVKRAQVTLVEELAKQVEWEKNLIYVMHPGWVKTDGLKDALPGFYRLMNKRLRTPDEGADTILWCLLTENPPESGGFYFDRKKVSPYISQKYVPSSHERRELLETIESLMPKK